MNLKERGITVGDLLIILIIILTSTILFKTYNKNNKTTTNLTKQEKILINENSLSKYRLEDLSV